jgi:thioester reductase-like protein
LGPGDIALEQHLSDPQPAIGLGYTESKWVAEEILETAAVQNKALFNPLIIRLGQLSGAANGAWNSSEWFPVLLRSSQLLGRLPIISGVSFY